jgi:hypothetical protein
MTYLVYHFDMNKYVCFCGNWRKVNPRTRQVIEGDCEAPSFPEDYEMVASVTTEKGIEDVFRLTNHIDYDWTENTEVIACGQNNRSTSVGDVVIDGAGKKLLCAGCGWEEL